MSVVDSYANLNVKGWDGYGGEPIAPETIAKAKRVEKLFSDLPADLNPAPGGDGSIGFEIQWRDGSGRELWIDVLGEQMTAFIPTRSKPTF